MFTGPSDAQAILEPTQHRFSLHGAAVELSCAVPALRREIRATFGGFALRETDSFSPCLGAIAPYEQAEVLRRLSPTANLVARTPELVEIYRDGERFWCVDDRWGMCEINLLKNTWRSWVIPTPEMDTFPCMEMAVMWPLAHLLRGRGLHLIPAASVAQLGAGTLLISPFALEGELCALRDAGYQFIGQRWTVLRDNQKEVLLLNVPGRIERNDLWIDLAEGRPNAGIDVAPCREILIVRHGRRASTQLREADAFTATNLLRRSWPVPELYPQRRLAPLASRLSQVARCWEVQLSRKPAELVELLRSAREKVAAA